MQIICTGLQYWMGAEEMANEMLISFYLILLFKGHHSVDADTATLTGICYASTSRQKES